MTNIIGIIGKKRSGKDTVADYINLNYEYEKKKFAGPMKEAIKILFNFTDDQLETDLKDEIDPYWGVSPRIIMQSMGTEYLQYELSKIIPSLGNNFAVKRMFLNPCDNIVISDVRFIHEANEIKNRGGYLIKIIRNTNLIDTHISETGIDSLPYDKLIDNNGTLDELNDKIDNIMKMK